MNYNKTSNFLSHTKKLFSSYYSYFTHRATNFEAPPRLGFNFIPHIFILIQISHDNQHTNNEQQNHKDRIKMQR